MKQIPCLPSTEPQNRVPPGSVQQHADCGHVVWVSPETERERRRGSRVVCVGCVRRDEAVYTAQMIDRARDLGRLVGR